MNISPAWELVRGIEPMSLCDWPGRLSAVLFFGGCDLRCPHCHNAALAWRPGSRTALPAVSVRRFVTSHAKWLDGCVLTGGEPTLIPGLAAFAAEIAACGPAVKIDSNGMHPEVLAAVLERLPEACFSVDVKAPFAKYGLVTGGGVTPETAATRLDAVFSLARQHPDRFAFRTTLVPELTEDDVREIRESLPSGFSLTVQPFRQPGHEDRKEAGHAQADSKARWMSGNVVDTTYCPGDFKGPQGQRHPGSAAVHASCP